MQPATGLDMQVRPIEARDEAAWRRLFAGYIAFYEADVPEAVIDATWQRLASGGEGVLYAWVAVDEAGEPIGFAHALFHRSTWSPTWYCYLEDLYVDPGRRQQGAGRALIEAVYRAADVRQCTRTYWVTEEANAAARKLYDRLARKAPFVQYRR
jgi:GNAT superfamily N-acetyltransferase